jgi:hypothetical protein
MGFYDTIKINKRTKPQSAGADTIRSLATGGLQVAAYGKVMPEAGLMRHSRAGAIFQR